MIVFHILLLLCLMLKVQGLKTDTEKPQEITSLLPDFHICGIRNSDKIIAGNILDIFEHPWLALLKYETKTRTRLDCEGILISHNYVLTAAHCVTLIPNSWKLSVRLGEWDTSKSMDCVWDDCSDPVQDIPIENIIVHEGYKSDIGDNDIALIRLKNNATFSEFVQPVCLPVGEAYTNGTREKKLLILGWGKEGTGFKTDVKNRKYVQVSNHTLCSNAYKALGLNISEAQICINNDSANNICPSGSGGALLGVRTRELSWVVLGIESHSACEETPIPYGVYTSVSFYIDWILSNLRP